MSKDMKVLSNDVHATRKLISAHEAAITESSSDNFTLTNTQIKELVLDETRDGRPFYPSDIAMEHGLDLEAVVTAVEELRDEGKLERKD